MKTIRRNYNKGNITVYVDKTPSNTRTAVAVCRKAKREAGKPVKSITIFARSCHGYTRVFKLA